MTLLAKADFFRLSAQNGQFMLSEVRLGSRGDSFYEYLL